MYQRQLGKHGSIRKDTHCPKGGIHHLDMIVYFLFDFQVAASTGKQIYLPCWVDKVWEASQTKYVVYRIHYNECIYLVIHKYFNEQVQIRYFHKIKTQ